MLVALEPNHLWCLFWDIRYYQRDHFGGCHSAFSAYYIQVVCHIISERVEKVRYQFYSENASRKLYKMISWKIGWFLISVVEWTHLVIIFSHFNHFTNAYLSIITLKALMVASLLSGLCWITKIFDRKYPEHFYKIYLIENVHKLVSNWRRGKDWKA